MSNFANNPYPLGAPVIRIVATKKVWTPAQAFRHEVVTVWFCMTQHTPAHVIEAVQNFARDTDISSVRAYTDYGAVSPLNHSTYNRSRLDAIVQGATP